MTHQCLYIAKILLSGRTYSKGQSMKDGIGSVHSRIRALNGWIGDEISTFLGSYPRSIGSYIVNVGSRDGHPDKNGNRCAVYKLPACYRKALRAALKRRGMLA